MINRETSKYEESRKWNNLTGNYAEMQKKKHSNSNERGKKEAAKMLQKT